jgi:hypothetical protein
MLKKFPITLLPNMPACQDHDFHEEWFSKTPICLSHNRLQIISPRPVNLELGPYPMTEIASKK